MAPSVHPDAPIGPLVEALKAALDRDLVGLYAYGSAVSGGFDPQASDLDLVAVTEREAGDLDLDALHRVHRSFVADHPDWDDRLDVVYVGTRTLRDFRTSMTHLAVVSPGECFHLTGPARDWSQNWYLVRDSGITLAGRAPAEVLPKIARAEFLSAVASYARWLASQDLEALSPGALAYAVLSECRALHTLRTGRPCSKQEGAAWVAGWKPQRKALIERALACRLSRGRIGFDDPDVRASALAFVRSAGVEVSS